MPDSPPPRSRSGPGRLLIAVYATFALAATARASWQIATDFAHAPVAYTLSAFAAVVYLVATVGIARQGRTSHRVATVSCVIELAGVIVVGGISVLLPRYFPDDTVWSGFGAGYGFVPLVLPVLGLLWLRRLRRAR